MFIKSPIKFQKLEDVELWCYDLWLALQKELTGSATWNPGNIAVNSLEAKDITITGAQLGDYAQASFSLDVSDLILSADVTAENTVTVILTNNSGGAVDLGEGTVYVRVVQRTT